MQRTKTEQTKANVEKVPTAGETKAEAGEVADLIQGQQMEHAATVVLSVKRDSVLPMGKLARIVTTKITLLTYVGNTEGRGLVASTVKMVHPSEVETTTEETSKATMVSGATKAATEARGVAISHTKTLIKYKLMNNYMTSSKKKAASAAMMIMLITQSLIRWCLNKATQ